MFTAYKVTLLVYVTALAAVLNLMFYLSLVESEIVEAEEYNEAKTEYAIYYYPVLTEIEKHLLVWKRYEEIET